MLCDLPGDNESIFIKNFKDGEIYGIQLSFGKRMFQNIRVKNAMHYLQERLLSVSFEVVKWIEFGWIGQFVVAI